MLTSSLRYVLVIVGFLLFLVSILVSFETIDQSSKLLKQIKEDHFHFFTTVETIRTDIEEHHANTYLFLIYRHDFQKKLPFDSISKIDNKFSAIVAISRTLELDDAIVIIEQLQKKVAYYKVLEKKLMDNFPRIDSTRSMAELLEHREQLNSIKQSLSQLSYLAKENFLNKIKDLMLAIEHSKRDILFVLMGGLLILIVSFINLIRHNKRSNSQLLRAYEAEEKQRVLQEELTLHNDNLEKEVAKKTLEATYRFYHNSLTNLPNRLKLMESIEKANNAKLALFDIDKFQNFNDYFGSKRGDNAIIFLANKLNFIVEEPLELFHLSGDAFAIFSDDRLSEDSFLHHTLKIFDQVKSFEVVESENRLVLNITAGFALDKESLFSKADIALKRAKQQHRDYLIYDDKKAIRDNFLRHLNQLRELTHAINKDRIEIYLQPICEAQSKVIEKYEVLVRLINTKDQVITPIDFLEVAREAKLYPKITEIVFKKTIEIINRGKVKCSMNISIDDILNKQTRLMIMEGLSVSQYPQNVTFELLESEEIEKYEKVQTFISEIKSYGAKLAIDDFGTGYSNFDHLMHLDANFLKIDGSLIKGLEDDTLSQNFVRAMVGFAKELGMKTIAEYVASEAIYNELLDYGIDYVQGYWLGKPEPVDYYLLEES